MCPSAYESISGLALTNKNYLEAVEVLKQYYGKPQLLINTYKEQFIKLDKIEKSNNVSRLRTFFNKIEIRIRNFSYEIWNHRALKDNRMVFCLFLY